MHFGDLLKPRVIISCLAVCCFCALPMLWTFPSSAGVGGTVSSIPSISRVDITNIIAGILTNQGGALRLHDLHGGFCL